MAREPGLWTTELKGPNRFWYALASVGVGLVIVAAIVLAIGLIIPPLDY